MNGTMMICAATGKPCEHSGCIGTGCVKQTGAATVDWSKIHFGTIGASEPAPTPDTVEAVARAIYDSREPALEWEENADQEMRREQAMCRDMAKAAIAAYEARRK